MDSTKTGAKGTKNEIGLPQGNNFSPVCANIMLNELDQELERKGVKFVRYADDCMSFARSERAAHRILESVTKFVEGKLFLQINREKTKVGRIGMDTKFLVFGFYKSKEGWKASIHKKSRTKFVKKMREVLSRRCPRGIEKTKEMFNTILRGWFNYFKLGISKTSLNPEDAWMRRIRQLYLVSWKRNFTCYTNLLSLTKGKLPKRCCQVAFSHEQKWAKARHSNCVLTNKILEKLGWYSVASLYKAENGML